VQLYKSRQELAQGRVWKGEQEQVRLGIEDELFITIPRGRYGDLDAQVEMRPELIAPIAEGEEVGQISIRLGDDELTTRGLIALETIEEAGFFGRAWDGVTMWFDGLFEEE
jgi:D-alanyl-D-alanine carboxypeptidase (penicillin-binding protein 5/6)